MPVATRTRYSIQHLQELYDSGKDRSLLENLIRAWRGIKALPPYHPDSFFMIAGYHGEPFRGPGVTDPSWWGGYCNHGNVLFPTWHRVYLYRLENALRSIPGCKDVTLPYWDELVDPNPVHPIPIPLPLPPRPPHPIPSVLTSPKFKLDGVEIPNPLYSYTLQEALIENVTGTDNRYTKPVGYETVRYPLSGLVGTEEDRKQTQIQNAAYPDANTNIQILNSNVAAWLDGTVQITKDGDPDHGIPDTRMPDTFSVRKRFEIALAAPNYTVFSNNTSMNQWIKDHGSSDPHYVVSLESPHNAIHLALGGFYQKGVYNADPIIGANGDMGDNETAGFDPIFYFHHCFIDYAFWKWQQRHGKTAAGSLEVIAGYPGTVVPPDEATPYLPPKTDLDMNTALYPFRKPDQTYYTSNEITDIEGQLGYTYGLGSLDVDRIRLGVGLETRVREINAQIVKFKRVRNVNRAHYPGSFVIRTFARRGDGPKVEIGHDAILSRRNIAGCRNCQNKLEIESFVPLHKGLIDALRGDGQEEEIEYSVEIHTHDNLLGSPNRDTVNGPLLEDL